MITNQIRAWNSRYFGVGDGLGVGVAVVVTATDYLVEPITPH